MNPLNINVLVLAYLGDTIYERYVREYLIRKSISSVNELQKEAVKFVSAKSQAKLLKIMMENSYFTEEENSILMRGRNYKSSSHPKNCNIVTYKHATALESLIGYLYIDNKKNRIDEIMNYIFSLDLNIVMEGEK